MILDINNKYYRRWFTHKRGAPDQLGVPDQLGSVVNAADCACPMSTLEGRYHVVAVIKDGTVFAVVNCTMFAYDSFHATKVGEVAAKEYGVTYALRP